LKQSNILRLTFTVAYLLLGSLAHAQVYTWKDANTGASKISSVPPPWYSRNEKASGPRVIVTLGGKVIDDTGLPVEDRLELSGKSRICGKNTTTQTAGTAGVNAEITAQRRC
jgi:hypothetical protein